jgi:NAD(P)-dependent dehydrogenase (short-subunit alcohol dehydrogenase family)
MGEVDLAGRTAVITGASRGIGEAIAREAAQRGMNLGLCARNDPALVASEGVHAERVDVTDEESMAGFAARVQDRFGAIDLWVNNAGILSPVAPIRDVDVGDFRKHLDTNVTGVFIGSRLFVRHRRSKGGNGVLINISSGAAWNAYSGWGAYCAAKAAVERLSEVVALEEAESGLRVHAIAPGLVDTEMQTLIRACSPDRFPAVDRFKEAKSANSFNSGEYVAKHLLAIAFDPERFTEEVALRLPDEKG